MDLNQNKLSKYEWDCLEIPASNEEKIIYNLIIESFDNVNLIHNHSNTIQNFLKLNNKKLDEHIYNLMIEPNIIDLYKLHKIKYKKNLKTESKINKSDLLRLENILKNINDKKKFLVEFIIFEELEILLANKEDCNVNFIKSFYTIKIILNNKIENFNKIFLDELQKILNYFEDDIDKISFLKNINKIIIDNNTINQFKDKSLFDHQKKLFQSIKSPSPKLIFYTAPTGTGKTLSPLGISQKYKIIFVCAVRHVGLALAKAAITCEKCVAFAFGCNDVDDIRLHYFSAKEYIKNKKTGGIFKVDNTCGEKVEIMICDIKSYLIAMRYMISFNDKKNIVLYWDEPTITLDYKEHEFHKIIQNNWNFNEIENIVLSSATLPNRDDLSKTILDYKSRFDGDFIEIKSYDYKKSISIISREGYVVVPHLLSNSYLDLQNCINYIGNNNTILKYVDIEECCKFILYINKKKYCNDNLLLHNYFKDIVDLSIENIKLYYLNLLKFIKKEDWDIIYNYFFEKRKKKFNSSIYLSTTDSFTLTNGPTLYLTDEIEKIGIFLLQTAKIPNNIIEKIEKILQNNHQINDKINQLEKNFEDIVSKNEKKDIDRLSNNSELKPIISKINNLKNLIESINLDEIYIPNTKDHLFKYGKKNINNAFTCDISENIIEKIMLIDNIDNHWKILLLMGIGVFSNNLNQIYLEIMKELAKNKKLYIIIATTDFIYGTNYQFDHCIIGKDLIYITQEKIIQSMGRVGRNSIKDNYSIRLRDDNLIKKIFYNEKNKMEVINMQKLFNGLDSFEIN